MNQQIDYLGLYLTHHAQEYSGKIMLSFMGHTYTYKRIYEQAQALARYFSKVLKLKPGDRVAIVMPNTPQFVISFLAAQLCGLITVGINPLYTQREIKQILDHAEAKCVLISNAKAQLMHDLVETLKIRPHVITSDLTDSLPRLKAWGINFYLRWFKGQKKHCYESFMSFRKIIKKHKGHQPICLKRKSHDIALLQYTSGTTGLPKGVMLTHNNILSNIHQVNDVFSAIGIQDGDKQLLVLPFFHIYGLSVFLNGLKHRFQGVLIANPQDTDALINTLAQEKPNILPIINTLMVSLLQNPRFQKMDFSWLHATITGGMATQLAVANRWRQITGCVVNQGYGLSETSPIIAITRCKKHEHFLNHVGQVLKETKVKLLNRKGRVVKQGEPGELYVKGPQVMSGYWRSIKETAAVMKNGWFKTGDIARIDNDGNIEIVDRIKDMIVISGFNVFPSEVEYVLNQHEKVIESAVIGAKSNFGNEIIKAFIVVESPLTKKSIKQFCKTHLASYKVPGEIVFVDEIPKSHIGKILKRNLKAAV